MFQVPWKSSVASSSSSQILNNHQMGCFNVFGFGIAFFEALEPWNQNTKISIRIMRLWTGVLQSSTFVIFWHQLTAWSTLGGQLFTPLFFLYTEQGVLIRRNILKPLFIKIIIILKSCLRQHISFIRNVTVWCFFMKTLNCKPIPNQKIVQILS